MIIITYRTALAAHKILKEEGYKMSNIEKECYKAIINKFNNGVHIGDHEFDINAYSILNTD